MTNKLILRMVIPLALLPIGCSDALVDAPIDDTEIDSQESLVIRHLKKVFTGEELALLSPDEIGTLYHFYKGTWPERGFVLDRGEVGAFQAAGNYGGGVLAEGTMFEPAPYGKSILFRGADSLSVFILTSGLPPGAYTLWWNIYNNPRECRRANTYGGLCSATLDFNKLTNPTVYFAGGRVVGADGVGIFWASTAIGDDLGTPGSQHILGDGLVDPDGAEVHLTIRYHGPAGEDPVIQPPKSRLANCFAGANAIDHGAPFGIQCFEPQMAVHP